MLKFSSMAFIYSKLRNSLCPETVGKLVYVPTNSLQFSVNSDFATNTKGEVSAKGESEEILNPRR
jgi:hypothetical protein